MSDSGRCYGKTENEETNPTEEISKEVEQARKGPSRRSKSHLQRPIGIKQYKLSGESPRVCHALHVGNQAKHRDVDGKEGRNPIMKGFVHLLIRRYHGQTRILEKCR